MEQLDVLVLLDVSGLEEKEKFEKHVVKEGFIVVEEENFVYTAKSSTTTFSTKAYILEVFKKGLQKQDFKGDANLIFLLNETPYPAYYYDKTTNDFELVEETKEDK